MLQNAKDDAEKINACNLLWTLAFDKENRKQIKNDESVIPELKKLATSENSEIKRAAAGALWECEGKEKYAEEKQQSVTVQQVTGAHVQYVISYVKVQSLISPVAAILLISTWARMKSRHRKPGKKTVKSDWLLKTCQDGINHKIK